MDPASVAVLIKALDVAFLAINAWGRYEQAKADSDPIKAQIRELRERVLAGEVSNEDANRALDALIQIIVAPRKAAIGRL